MKNFSNELVEMTDDELMNVEGGKWPYVNYSWSGTDNEITYAIEAGANGCKALYNGLAWCVNQF